MKPVFRYTIPVHVAGWVLFLVVPLLTSPAHEFAAILADPANVGAILIRTVLWAGLFYLNLLFIMPALMLRRHAWLYLATIVVAVALVTLVNSRIHHLFSQQYHPGFPGDGPHFQDSGNRPPPPPDMFDPGSDGPRPPRPPMLFGPPGPFVTNFLISMVVISVSTSLVFWNQWLRTRAEEQERAFQKLASELAVLKLQISPHFLFNTLNNIRWLIRSGSDHAEASVVKLSGLLRYVLYQTGVERVPLDKEAEHLQDYVALQKMRLVDSASVLVTAEGIQTGQMIVPLLLMPLVENVFKYGEFTDGSRNEITLVVRDHMLVFRTVNKIAVATEPRTGNDYGIGLENVRRRLALHYPQKHDLKHSVSDGIFNVTLEIILN